MCDPALHDQQCQVDLAEAEASVEAIQGLRQRLPYMWDDPPGILTLMLSLLRGHLINQEYLSSTNFLVPNFPVRVKQIFSSTLCWIMYLYICVRGGEACGGVGRESW